MVIRKISYYRAIVSPCLFAFLLPPAFGNENSAISSNKELSENSIVIIQPDSIHIPYNPFTGWMLYVGMGVDVADFWVQYDHIYIPELGHSVSVTDYAHTLYIRASWTDFNPQEDTYGRKIDSNLRAYIEGAHQRSMRLVFCVVADSRGKRTELTPQSVKNAGAKGFMNKGKWSSYSNDPVLQKYYTKFVKALAANFNNPSRIGFIDGFGLGKWGGYHTMIYSIGDDTPKKVVFDWITDIYSQTFGKVPVVINHHRRIGAGKDWVDDEHLAADNEEMLEEAIKKGYSLCHDVFGMTTYYGSWEYRFVKKRRNICPATMESGRIVKSHSYWQDPRGYRKDSYEDARRGEFDDSKEVHVNMMDFRFGDTKSWFKDALDLTRRLPREGGYRLYPSEIFLSLEVFKKTIPTVKHCWNNLGWGYYPTNIPQWNQKYKVAFALFDSETNEVRYIFVDTDTDLSKWIEGSPAKYVFEPDMSKVKMDTYAWAVGLVNRSNKDLIGLDIAAKGGTLDSGWLKLSKVSIKK